MTYFYIAEITVMDTGGDLWSAENVIIKSIDIAKLKALYVNVVEQ